MPEIGPADLLLEVVLCGVDGSELAMFSGHHEYLNARVPVIFGDEIVGRVVAVGASAAERRGLVLGDRVVVEARWPCEEGCHTCQQGQYYLCERRGLQNGYGTLSAGNPPHLWGGYASHVFVPPEALVYRVPDVLSDRTALIACSPLANGLRWVREAGVRKATHVVVIGPGPQGLSCALAAVALGRCVTLVGLETDVERLRTAETMGAATYVTSRTDTPDLLQHAADEIVAAHGPVDAVIEVSGSPGGKDLAMCVVRALGTIVSVASPNPSVRPFDWRTLMWKEITVKGRISHPNTVSEAFGLARRLAAEGIDVGEWVTHVFPLDKVPEAIRTAAYKSAARPIKVALDPMA
ncbi:zinc-binding dehydrogenase [Nocardioides sp. NPDC051685]|uniref:zinc-binding dehydrogenase n=1 Tax=Nocardioides sp. NPDC051685 TaxID=3364334 RepID=UPI0037B45A52